MSAKTDREYFNNLASKWDEICFHDLEKINTIIENSKIASKYQIMDVGTGTGVMIPHLLSKLDSSGKIFAIDVSENMLDEARKKFKDDRISYIHGDILELNDNGKYDLIMCYSMFPHFKSRKNEAIGKLSGMLREGGKLVIAHSQSRDAINSLHKKAGEAVKEDKLPEIHVLSDEFTKNNLKIDVLIDNEHMYMISGIK